MEDLPLFPLNTVLFPGMPLDLHIFEERYKKMVHYCLENEKPFGVVLIKQGQEANGPLAVPYNIGCMAKILKVQHLDQGNYQLAVMGIERFRIISTHSRDSYLTGKVESFPLEPDNLEQTADLKDKITPLVRRYLIDLGGMEERDASVLEMPDESNALAFFAAVLLQIPLQKKQALLEASSILVFYRMLVEVYQMELFMIKEIKQTPEPGTQGSFSLN